MCGEGKGYLRIRKVFLGCFSEQRAVHVGEASQSFTLRGTIALPGLAFLWTGHRERGDPAGTSKMVGGQLEWNLSQLCPPAPRLSAACSKYSPETQPSGSQSLKHNDHIHLLEHCERLRMTQVTVGSQKEMPSSPRHLDHQARPHYFRVFDSSLSQSQL